MSNPQPTPDPPNERPCEPTTPVDLDFPAASGPPINARELFREVSAAMNNRTDEVKYTSPDGSTTRIFRTGSDTEKSFGIEVLDADGKRIGRAVCTQYDERPKPRTAAAGAGGQPPDDSFEEFKVTINGNEKFDKAALGIFFDALQNRI